MCDSIKKNKMVGIKLAKELKELNPGNPGTLRKETRGPSGGGGPVPRAVGRAPSKRPCPQIDRRVGAAPVEIPMMFFTEVGKKQF